MCIVLLLTNLYSPVFAKENDDTQNADRLFTQAEVSDYRAYGTYPTKSGHVFAGWYEDSSHETPVTGNTPSNGAYAKFVSEEVLTLRFQLRSGTTRQSATTDLRAITSVDSLLYQKVGFELQVDNNVHEITSNTVYSTMASYSDENQQKYQASDVFDETDSKYFVTKVLTGVKNTSFEKEISFTPFWVTMDGTKVSGEERTIRVLDGVQFGANPLGFIAASTDPTHSKVERVTKDGEEVIKADYRKVIFEGIQTLETANTSINPEFHAAGYTHVQFDMYIEKAGEDGISFNTSLQNIQTDGKGQDWKDIVVEGVGTQGDFVRTYKNGVRMPIREGAWYTVSMRVDNHSTDVSLVSYNSKHTIAYLKNLAFTNSFPEEVPFTANPLGFEAGVYTTVETTTKDGEEVIKVNGRKVLFEDVMDGNGVKGDFFYSEYQYVTFDMYIESLGANGIALNTSQVYAYADGQGSDWNGEDNKGEYVRTYRNGVRTPVNTGAWYTVSMKVESHSIDVSLVSPGIPSVIYLKNLSFTNEFAEFGSEFGFIAGTNTTLTQVVKDGEKVARVDGKWVYFQNVMTANGEKGTFFDDGYKYVAFDMYIESVGNSFLFNTSGFNIWTNGQGYDWRNNLAGNGKQGDYLRSYLDGVSVPLNIGAWYTVYMKVESFSSEANITAYQGAATIYLKNLTFANDFPEEAKFTAKPLGFVAGTTDTTITNVIKDGEEAIKVEGRKVCFQDVLAPSGEKGQFFYAGYRYVTFDLYIESVTQNFLFNTSGMNIFTTGAGYDWSVNGSQGNYLRAYQNGLRTVLNKGAWYTVSMRVESNSSDVSIASQNGVATIYLKNLTFANDFPEEVRFTAKSLGFVAGTTDTTLTQVTKDGEEAIKVEGRKVCFQDVMTASGVKGKFFSDGCQYITFDMYIESVAQNFLFNTSQMSIWTNGAGYDWSVNGSQGDYLRTYQNGVYKPINKAGWYTVSMKVESNSTDVSIASQNGTAVFYLKNLTFYQGAQAPSTYLTISDAINYQTYYFDSVNGDDANNGLFANAPKKSVAEANRIISSCTQETPTKILFKAGSRYTETLKVVSFRAKKESPLLIGVYGQTPENQYATFSASPYCVEVSGSNVRVSGLELTCPTANRGFYVYTSEAGAMSNVVLKNNYLHDINFLWDDLTEGNRPEDVDFDTVDPEAVCSNARYTYQNSAIYFTASTSSTQGASWFENVWIEQNEIERVARAGIFINSDWVRRPGINWGHNNYLDDQTGWYPHKNFNVINNDISYVGGDGIVAIAVDGGFIQGNTSYHAQYLGRSGYYSAGIWCHSSKNLVFQYNEAAYTHMANGSGDGQGFDIDIANQNILFQFNYSHHNEGGGILLINAPTYNADGEKYYTDWKNVTIRNNVFADNDRTAFHIQGKVEKLFVENNTIVIPGTNGEQGIIKSNPHVDNTATGKDWVFSNNIFYLRNKRTSKFEIDFCPNAEFSNNIFYNFEDNFLTNKVKNYLDCYTFNPQLSVTEAMPGIDNMVQFSPSESGCFTSGGVLGMLLTSDYAGNFAVGKRYIGAFCE